MKLCNTSLNFPFCAPGQSSAHVRNHTCGDAEQGQVYNVFTATSVTALTRSSD